MIKNKEDLNNCLRKDKIVNNIPVSPSWTWKLKHFFYPNYRWKFIYDLRMCEYYYYLLKHDRYGMFYGVIYMYYKLKLRRLSFKLGYTIPINCFDSGLSIPHYGTIVVNDRARIGKNCRLHVGVNIGASTGKDGAPRIGNNVYIGPGAILFGNIKIADNITIGANATVNKSFDNPNVIIAGTPAKIVKENCPSWWVNKLDL